MTVTGILPAICTTTKPIEPDTPRLPEPRTTPGTSNAKSLINIYLNTSQTTGNRLRPDPAQKSRPPRRARLVGHPRRSNEGNIFVVVPKLFTPLFYPRKATVFRFRGTPLPFSTTPCFPTLHNRSPSSIRCPESTGQSPPATPTPRRRRQAIGLASDTASTPPRKQSPGGNVQMPPVWEWDRGGRVLIALRKALERRRGRRHPVPNGGSVQIRPQIPSRRLAACGSRFLLKRSPSCLWHTSSFTSRDPWRSAPRPTRPSVGR